MKCIAIKGKILVPHPQDEKAIFIIKRRLEGKVYKVLDLEHVKVIPTAEEEAAWQATQPIPSYKFYAVLNRNQLGVLLSLSGQELDDAWNAQPRHSDDGLLCLHQMRMTKEEYIGLPPAQKALVYPLVNPDPEQYPNLETIYDYLAQNISNWDGDPL